MASIRANTRFSNRRILPNGMSPEHFWPIIKTQLPDLLRRPARLLTVAILFLATIFGREVSLLSNAGIKERLQSWQL